MAKKIDLKTIDMIIPGLPKPQPLGYANQLVTILREPVGQQGITMDDILDVAPLLKKVNEHLTKGTLILEDGEYKTIMDRLSTFRFPFVDQAVVDFITDMQNAETVELGVVDKKAAKDK